MLNRILIGLGNPGRKYRNNRHNLGFIITEGFRKRCNAEKFKKSKNRQWEYSSVSYTNQTILLVRPLSYMNRSGWVVEDLLDIHKSIKLNEILVVVDDVNLNWGQVKLRSKGSAGGHNGLKDIITTIGEDFPRLRIGCGPMPKNVDLVEFVLSDISKVEYQNINQVIEKACTAIESWLLQPIEEAMNKVNQSAKVMMD
jgi:peptidyl-tRNA hydrolase, PTH1 family